MTVYVVQNQLRWSHETKGLVEKFDTTPAEEYGELSFLLGSNASPFNPVSVIDELTEKLQAFTDEDHLLLIGNPCLIGFAVAIAADINDGRVRLLQWSGKDRRYIEVDATVFDCSGDGDGQ